MGASASNSVGEFKFELIRDIKKLNGAQVGAAAQRFVNIVGLQEKRLDESTFDRIFSAMYEQDTGFSLAMYHAMLDGSGYSEDKSNGLPCLQVLAVLYLLSAPDSDSLDEKVDAIVSMCQFKHIPNDVSAEFNHMPPNAQCNKSELHLALECCVMGLAQLCCRSRVNLVLTREIASIVDEIFQYPRIDTILMTELKHELCESERIQKFLQQYQIDCYLLKPIKVMVMRSLEKLEDSFKQALLALNQKMAVSEESVRGAVARKSRIVNPNQKDDDKPGVVGALPPRRCVSLILDNQHNEGAKEGVPFGEAEAEALEAFFLDFSSSGEHTVPLQGFKVVCLALKTFDYVHMISKQSRPQGLCQSCLPSIQRLFNMCAKDIGYRDHPDYVTKSPNDGKKGTHASASLYDLLQIPTAHTHGSHVEGVPRVPVLTRSSWLQYQCEQYATLEQEHQFDQEVVNFFLDKENIDELSQGSGYIADPLVAYDFVFSYLQQRNLPLLYTLDMDKMKIELAKSQNSQASNGDDYDSEDKEEYIYRSTHKHSGSTSVLRDHVKWLGRWIVDLALEPGLGLSLQKIRIASSHIKATLVKFTEYFRNLPA